MAYAATINKGAEGNARVVDYEKRLLWKSVKELRELESEVANLEAAR